MLRCYVGQINVELALLVALRCGLIIAVRFLFRWFSFSFIHWLNNMHCCRRMALNLSVSTVGCMLAAAAATQTGCNLALVVG